MHRPPEKIFQKTEAAQLMRMIVTYLSVAALIAFGYTLAGFGGYLVGKGNLSYIFIGLPCGAVCALLALYLWKKNPKAFYSDTPEGLSQAEVDQAKFSVLKKSDTK